MKIELKKIKIRDLVDGYKNDDENGVYGYHGQLEIRPQYQREFIYDDKQQKAVIETVKKGFPLNVMYWVKTGDVDGREHFELLDGQQRTMSICSFYQGSLWVIWNNDLVAFHNLTEDQKNVFLDYELTVYVCEGSDSEKLEWFKTINIAGEKLVTQEIRSAVYAGAWVTDLKRKFAKTNCVARLMGGDYLDGIMNRQAYLETVLDWISGGQIELYMSQHQHDENADMEWQYFQTVIGWVKALFITYRKEMKGLPWGTWYNKYKDVVENNPNFGARKLEEKVVTLMEDDDVTNHKGIYYFIFTGDEKYLSIRDFDKRIKRQVYEEQKGLCKKCGKHFEMEEMDADHITPWSKGGKTIKENCQMLCAHCNRTKSDM